MNTETVKEVRRLQREGRALKKRFLARKDATLIAIRDAVDYANASGWNKPSRHPDPETQAKLASRWADNWMRLYKTKLDALLASSPK